ncbi:hypothetical protein SAMN05421505_14927 [Sinosporangium album]|uniref:Uncharacterized protein n=1 Tax=Sinosporangium album TaxID=504805 RepID=A0A1G8KC57_9ACTN|nr:hypothetical protein [Sinosporangium album]SDI40992.1 hypothetical protein SAMN05421505_14927 [Sinosporangium album]
MSYSLTTYVHVIELPGPGSKGRSGVFGPGEALPIWALEAITNPDVWVGGRVPAHIADAVDRPPAAGQAASGVRPAGPSAPEREPEASRPAPRATKDEWARYVLSLGARTEAELEGLTKAELVELVDQDEE